MCYGMRCKYEESGGPDAGECTLPAIMRRNIPSDAACAEDVAFHSHKPAQPKVIAKVAQDHMPPVHLGLSVVEPTRPDWFDRAPKHPLEEALTSGC